ncbi:BPL-N domain-containing protein [Chitinilyticum aquatile]|uniref:BPL-N domain-containing protein n=1 Tax=Chitinilyticum aquatile TaxID=362520 RepID=UPI00041900F9|nr:BPL-N domain-containing protein [Chitinilyticum aquatile]
MRSFLLAILLTLSGAVHARTVGIFTGAGTCNGCGETVGAFFTARHDRVIYLNEKTLNAATLAQLQVYVQPGGSDDIDETLDALRPEQIKALRQFVKRGGSYLGICAGAYLAARYSDLPSRKPAFALVGLDDISAEIASDQPTLLPVIWQGKTRKLYTQSGPHLGRHAPPGATVLGRYQRSGRIAGLLTRHGQGKVMLLGPHLEAGRDWYQADGLSLQYGTAEAEFSRLIGLL